MAPTTVSSRHDDNEIAVDQSRRSNTFALEIPALLLFFSWNLTGTVFQNQIIYQTCLLRYNETICDKITNYIISDDLVVIEEELEQSASKIFMCRAILESIIPAFVSFFIGPWSDKYGRKPVLMSSFLGYFLVYVILAIMCLISTAVPLSPWFYLIAFIPLSLLGGTCALITGIFCYVSDVSSEEDRAFRMARMEAAVFIGLLLGALSSGYLYQITTGSVVFGCAAVSTLLAVIRITFYLEESIRESTSDIGRWAKFKALFNYKHVCDLFRTCFKRREHHGRILIWLIIFSLAATMFVLEGSVQFSYLFMREKFKWMINDYNLYAATNVVCQVVGNLLGTWVLDKKLGVPILMIAIIGYISAMTEYIVAGLAAYSWIFYVTSIVVMLKGVAVPMCRSFLANLVPSNEIGKIYSITTSMESLAPILAAPTYTMIYSNTLGCYPGAFNFFSAGIYLFCICLILTVYLTRRRQHAVIYERMTI